MSEFVLRDPTKKVYFVDEIKDGGCIAIGRKAFVNAFIRSSISGKAFNMEPWHFGKVERYEEINSDFFVIVTDREYLICSNHLSSVRFANITRVPKKNKTFQAIGLVNSFDPEPHPHIFIENVYANEVIDTFKQNGLYIVRQKRKWYCCRMNHPVLPTTEL